MLLVFLVNECGYVVLFFVNEFVYVPSFFILLLLLLHYITLCQTFYMFVKG